MKQLLFAFAAALFCFTTTASGQVKPMPKQIFTYVEQMPEFSGNLNDYLVSELKYPAKAKAAKKEGRVVVRFVIDQTGKVKDVEVVRPVDNDLDAEARRVVSAMPNWKPGIQAGKPVAVYYTLPIKFQL